MLGLWRGAGGMVMRLKMKRESRQSYTVFWLDAVGRVWRQKSRIVVHGPHI